MFHEFLQNPVIAKTLMNIRYLVKGKLVSLKNQVITDAIVPVNRRYVPRIVAARIVAASFLFIPVGLSQRE